MKKRRDGNVRGRARADGAAEREYFSRCVREVLDKLPSRFREAAQKVEIIVEDEPNSALLAEVDPDSDEPLLGLYVGTPLPERSLGEAPDLPDRIYVFRRPLERACGSRKELDEQIRITVLHELAHYFGFDEEHLEEIGYE